MSGRYIRLSGRYITLDTLERLTEAAAPATGYELNRAGAAGRGNHPWSEDPLASKSGLPLPVGVAPLHGNANGMGAVADLVVGRLS